MYSRCLTITALLLAASPLFADSIDDAEAKRRGVPVAQVQAESALAREKQKNAALEKQIADLQKQIAERTASAASQPAVASGTSDAPAPDASNGPRASSPLYDGFVNRYLAGDWTTLAADLAAKQKDIAALPAGNAADLNYIRQTLAECRPPWWDQLKRGQDTTFRPAVWKQSPSISYHNQRAAHASAADGNLTANWPASYMDSRQPPAPEDLDLELPSNHKFVRADLISGSIWQMIGALSVWGAMPLDKLKALSPDEQKQYSRYAAFMQYVTGAYYSTPPGRRYELMYACASFESANDSRPDWAARRPLGSAFLVELALHQNLYTNLHIQTIIGLEQLPGASTKEGFLAKPLYLSLALKPLTLAEDRHLRDMIKSYAESNADWKAPQVSLPNNLHLDLDPAKDPPLATERVKFISAQ